MPLDKRCMLITAITCGGGGYAIWNYFGRPDVGEIQDIVGNFTEDWDFWEDFGNFSDVLDGMGNWSDINIEDYWDNDPFLGVDNDPFVDDSDIIMWQSKGNSGLQLKLLNALDDSWEEFLDVAVRDWENGQPDTLTLTVKRGDIDHACEPVDGLMKVCNGNYKETGWVGINMMSHTNGGIIINSVAKMNEFYLLNSNDNERQYTMCHEIGHGFGLPHTDENFNNLDLGNCLDYTRFPQNNLHPDETNYNRLASFYGTVDGQDRDSFMGVRRRSANAWYDNISKQTDTIFSGKLKDKYKTAMSELEDELRQQVLSNSNTTSVVSIRNSENVSRRWRLLKEHPLGGEYSRRLNKKYSLKAHVLYPHSN